MNITPLEKDKRQKSAFRKSAWGIKLFQEVSKRRKSALGNYALGNYALGNYTSFGELRFGELHFGELRFGELHYSNGRQLWGIKLVQGKMEVSFGEFNYSKGCPSSMELCTILEGGNFNFRK